MELDIKKTTTIINDCDETIRYTISICNDGTCSRLWLSDQEVLDLSDRLNRLIKKDADLKED